jgi:hypothetical protein
MEKIFARSEIPYRIEVDEGGEFKNKLFTNYCSKNNIFVKYKKGMNKASFAEMSIGLAKRILYKMMRHVMIFTACMKSSKP